MMRIEIWTDTNSVRAFPHVKSETIKKHDNFMTFEYGDPERCESVMVNLNNILFIETMKEI